MGLRMSDNLREKYEKEEVGTISKLKINDSLKKEDDNLFFSKAINLDDSISMSKNITKKEINNYLSMVVSGKRYGFQKGLPYSGGIMLVSFEELKEMVDRGDNIIKAQCLDDNGILIDIEYESYRNIENNKQGRGR